MKVGRFSVFVVAGLMAVLFSLSPLWPWGRLGHRASGLQADSRLTPAAVAAIRGLLEPAEKPGDTSSCTGRQREVPDSGRGIA